MRKILIFLILILVLGVGVLGLQQVTQKKTLSYKPFTHAPDYSWLAGQLYYSDLEGGFWEIRYREKGEDKYGGHFVLGKTIPDNFKEGDFVLVRGKISEAQINIFMAGWLYSLGTIELLK